MNKQSRLEKLQASIKEQHNHANNASEQLEQAKLIESLNIYKEELELQNQELLETQHSLYLQRQHYQDLFELQPIANIIIDQRAVVKDLNPCALALLRMSKHQISNLTLHRYLTAESSLWLHDKLHISPTHSKQRYSALIELAISRQKHLQCRANLAIIPASKHNDSFAILALEDVTKESLLESERAIFKAMLDNSHALIFAVDLELNLLVANQVFHKLHNLQLQPGDKPSLRSFFPSQSIKRLENIYDTLFVRGIPVTYEYDQSNADKTRFYQTSGFPLRDDYGSIEGAGFITTDITDKMNAEIRLQTAMQFFSEGYEAVVITNHELRIIQANDSFLQLVGLLPCGIQNKSLLHFLKTSLPIKILTKIKRQLEESGFWEGELLAITEQAVELPVWLRLSRVPKEGQFRNYLAIVHDLTDAKEKEAHISKLAYTDSLTGLANRIMLREHVEQLLTKTKNKKMVFSLLYTDLDHFKEINDLHGHDVGDMLLVEAAERMSSLFRSSDLVCRLGGDEFVVLLPGISSDAATNKAEQLISTISAPYRIEKLDLYVTASVGIVSYPENGQNYAELMQHADLAMYSAKNAGKANQKTFSIDLANSVKRRYALQDQLKQALSKNEFFIVYQPIYCAKGKLDIVGVEALLRWKNSRFGDIDPDEFIPLLEESGHIVSVGEWIFETSCRFINAINLSHNKTLFCSVNVSAVQLWNSDFVSRFVSSIKQINIPFNLVKLELTERVAMEKPELVARLMKEIANYGTTFLLDDFGTGYSSLAYLKYLPIETLKIDRSFVNDIGKDLEDEIIIKALISLAKSLGISTTAEGVETQEQLQFLLNNGCNYVQGFYLSNPLGEDALCSLLSSKNN